MKSLKEFVGDLANKKEKAFVAYITAGDPNIYATETIVKTLVQSGVDIIELGVPFSDPVADGPTNQKAAERALREHTSLTDVLRLVKKLRADGLATPLVLFTYINPIFRMGFETFAERAHDAGVSGVLAVDLPPEEAGDYCKALAACRIDTVFLASPTTPASRLKAIDEASTGFVYYVSRTGVTGAQEDISASLNEEVAAVKKVVSQPLMIGFGISSPEQAKSIAGLGDGVVVGSAIVKLIEEMVEMGELQGFVEGLVKACKGGG